MPIFCGINGVKRKISGLCTGVDGVKKDLAEVWTAENGVKKLVYQAVKGTQIGNMPVGSVVKINEDGSPVNYLIVEQGLPPSFYDKSCEGTWLLRQDIAENDHWDYTNDNILEESDTHSDLNNKNLWLKRYDANIREAIKQVKIPYRKGGGKGGSDKTGSSGLSCKIFLLSAKEVGFTTSEEINIPSDGTMLSYFIPGTSFIANQRRVATLNGSPADWWLRTPHAKDTSNVWEVSAKGDDQRMRADSEGGVRPALILPQSALVDDLGNIIV